MTYSSNCSNNTSTLNAVSDSNASSSNVSLERDIVSRGGSLTNTASLCSLVSVVAVILFFCLFSFSFDVGFKFAC